MPTDPSPHPLHHELALGSTGPEVVLVQRALGVEATGYFGALTTEAVRAWQHAHGLAVDGIVGPDTWASLPDAPPAPAPPVQPHAPGQLVPRVRTPLTFLEVVQALRAGHVDVFGVAPQRPRLACAAAQVGLENARGEAVFGDNLGNVSAFGWLGDYNVVTVEEQLEPGDWRPVAMRFRVHASAEEGGADYWRLFAGRYGNALARFDAGDPAGAAAILHNDRYYTANEAGYAETMLAIYPEASALAG